MFEHAGELQRIEVVRIGRENGTVDLIRLVEPPVPVQHPRLLDGAGELRELRGRLLRHAILTRSRVPRRQTDLFSPAAHAREHSPAIRLTGSKKTALWIPTINRAPGMVDGRRLGPHESARMSIGSVSLWQQDQNFWNDGRARDQALA